MDAPKYRPGKPGDSIVTDGSNGCAAEKCRAGCDETYGGKLIAESIPPDMRRRLLILLNAFDRIPTEALEALLEKYPDASRRFAACVNACAAWGLSTEGLESTITRERWLLIMTPVEGKKPEEMVPGYEKLVERRKAAGLED